VIRFALPVLFEAALRAFFVACVLWAGLRLLRVKNVRAQKAAWSVVLLAGLAMPLLMLSHWFPAWAEVRLTAAASWSQFVPRAETPANIVHSEAPPARASTSAPESSPVAAESNAPLDASDVSFETLPDPATGRTPISLTPATVPKESLLAKTSRFPFDLLTVAWLVYLAVCAALLLRGLIGLRSSIRLWQQSKPVDADEQYGELGVFATRSSSRISSPVNIGSGIILPSDYSEWPTEKLRAVLAHEGSHVRQRDFYLQLLAGFYTAITWFSPLGWWLKHKLSELSEAISDRAGLEESASSSAYAQLLLEFAALPRPTLTGVAMARSNNLSHRIDRLLNESSFKQAFSGSRRAFVAALVIPAVLVLAASLVRVQAAATPNQSDSLQAAKLSQDQAPSQSASTGQSNPLPAQVSSADSRQAPPAPAAPDAAPAPPAPSSDRAPESAPAPPVPPTASQDSGPAFPVIPPIPPIDVEVHVPPIPPMPFLKEFEGHASCFANGDAYAIVGDPGTKTRFCGSWGPDGEAEVEKARTVAHGPFLLIRHDGKYYVVDDPAIVSQIETGDQVMAGLSAQMRALGEQFRDAGRQARDEARKATADIPAPDLSKETAELDATVASLKEKLGGTITREQLQEVQREVQAIQRRVIDAEVKAELKIDMSAFDAKEGKFNEQMSKMGAELGRTVQENQQKIGFIIDQSLKDGKAHPVN
jgi:beta-lactamase regulating signal transducer with metallopeptidase domain